MRAPDQAQEERQDADQRRQVSPKEQVDLRKDHQVYKQQNVIESESRKADSTPKPEREA
jgi:hypothetical protein